ncbi:DUF6300 family protein [Streptomyces sp. NPDC047841]|uniref:DUF6300 family protein n=1 Tax=Streptomyces sp. NPDC047841 TaxID=3154708 RepID=UPI00345718ED
MSFTRRYVVRPDGSFCRIGNLDGSLDNVPDEELARLHPERDEDEQPARPCSRCGTELLLHWHGPPMTDVWMELCPACDAHRPAARAFIQWHRDPDRDPKALPKLFGSPSNRVCGAVREPVTAPTIAPVVSRTLYSRQPLVDGR